ncbi:Cis-prenyltransferase [Trachipleistophora hominis]|uniref:Cis-prenyltransferase n=1 Tax=Trachipleistophora hominis TaxID=72359 RepID=L7JWB6_TRAHO|nr:Cis-prenyltransferase [Trachipleistophora hominis]
MVKNEQLNVSDSYLIKNIKNAFYLIVVVIIEYVVNNRVLIKILKIFPVPSTKVDYNVAFILDGNRRYARARNLSIKDGKKDGLLNLKRILTYIEHTNIKEVSVYAYSLQNFQQRDRIELESVFDLLRTERMEDFNYQLRFYGSLEFLKPKERSILKALESNTKFKGKRLNICILYSGLLEIKPYFDKPDILVRTGNQRRLSDFLLLHCANGCNLNFLERMWPEFEVWQFYLLLVKYSIENQITS